MEEITMAAAGLRERQDLQRWITEHPDLVAPGLLLITTEFDRWEAREQRVADRLDALFLDTSGAPVVVEFKRDKAADTVEMQALKYAAYCAQLTFDQLVEDYSSAHDLSPEVGREQLLDHAPALEEAGPRPVKILLVAGSFGPAVTSVVLWLREYGVDIGCIEVTVRAMPGAGTAIVTAQQTLPLPQAEDYLVRRRQKEQADERARSEPAEMSWEDYEAQLPAQRVAVARRLFERLTRYVQDHELLWTPSLRPGRLGFKRSGGYYVAVVNLRRETPVEFAVQLPEDPARLELQNPYPDLTGWWHAQSKQWRWAIPGPEDVPDVGLAVALSRRFQPETGPMRVPDQLAVSDGAPAPAVLSAPSAGLRG
jgi:hypothetical protein